MNQPKLNLPMTQIRNEVLSVEFKEPKTIIWPTGCYYEMILRLVELKEVKSFSRGYRAIAGCDDMSS